MADIKNLHVAPPLVRDPISHVTVDIIIPFHGQADKMINLVRSIYSTTKTPQYQMCVVDDCSPNENISQSFAKAPRMKYIRTPKHIGFGGAVDMGIKSTENSWICVLHSDCLVVQPKWLEELLRTMGKLRDKRVMMVSARTNNPGEGTPLKLKANRGAVDDDFILEEGFLPMYCCLMHRQMFRMLGSYIKTYPYAMYEDEELAARMKHKGLRQAISGKSWVEHAGSATINWLCEKQTLANYQGPDYRSIMEANYERCLSDIAQLGASELPRR